MGKFNEELIKAGVSHETPPATPFKRVASMPGQKTPGLK